MNDERRTTNDERRRFGIHPFAALRAGTSSFVLLPSAFCLLLFFVLGAYQLNLPGLHYDEAKEAGLNAMQLVTRQPVTAFRDATVQIGPWRLPLMVQDYIGSLNVLLAIPFLAVGGVNVIALRWLPLLTAALTLLLTWRVAWRLGGPWAAGVAALLLAANPSFIFWSRQGIFVTNLTALIFMASLLTALRWWTDRRPADLWLTAFLWGLGLYAKLLFVWAIGAMVAVGCLAWAVERRGQNKKRKLQTANCKSQTANCKLQTANCHPQSANCNPQSAIRTALIAAVCFAIPLLPLLVFNIRTGGTLSSIFGNLGRSYYGVDNAAYLVNLLARLKQLVTLLRGDHFWYLGEVYANEWVPWLAGGLVVCALGAWALGGWGAEGQGRRGAGAQGREGASPPLPLSPSPLLPLALLALMLAQSAFTVSDLFITHFALLLPLIPLTAGLAFAGLTQSTEHSLRAVRRSSFILHPSSFILLPSVFVLLWAGGDLWTTVRYHRILAISGGYAAHSDAIGNLATYLARRGPSSPVALDWGLDAPVRFLTAGKVNPIEVFGYAPLDAPDAGFAARVSGFLDNPDNIYLAHAAEATVFRGRVEALSRLAAERGLALREEVRFAERSGRPLFVVYRATKR